MAEERWMKFIEWIARLMGVSVFHFATSHDAVTPIRWVKVRGRIVVVSADWNYGKLTRKQVAEICHGSVRANLHLPFPVFREGRYICCVR